jgi:uncharacterized surface protein with fasciclin (FAS1) repeats
MLIKLGLHDLCMFVTDFPPLIFSSLDTFVFDTAKMKLSFLLPTLLASTVLGAPSFVSQYEYDGLKDARRGPRGNTVVDRLREDKRFSRFVEVLENERGLRDDLEKGQNTVFAPTNEAFEKFEEERRSYADEKREMRDIIKYHVASEADIESDDLHAGLLIPTGLRLKSLNDRHQRIRVYTFARNKWLNMEAQIVEADIEAENGRIHAIDRILTPPSNAMEMLYTVPTTFSTFTAALEKTCMWRDLEKEKGITVFAPSNKAWESLGYENLKYIFSCAGQQTEGGDRDSFFSPRKSCSEERFKCKGLEDLKKILENHIGTDLAYSTDMMKKETIKMKTLGREQLEICAKRRQGGGKGGNRGRDNKEEHRDVREYNFVLNDGEARVQFTDGLASNAAIFVVDNILVPESVQLPHDRMSA